MPHCSKTTSCWCRLPCHTGPAGLTACCWTRNRRRTRAASWAHAVTIAMCPAMRDPQKVTLQVQQALAIACEGHEGKVVLVHVVFDKEIFGESRAGKLGLIPRALGGLRAKQILNATRHSLRTGFASGEQPHECPRRL